MIHKILADHSILFYRAVAADILAKYSGFVNPTLGADILVK